MMTEYFTRGGEPVPASAVKMTASGKPYRLVEELCSRCGGQGGAEQWKHTGYTCFKCAGQRFFVKSRPVYTAERLAKLEAALTTRHAKLAAKRQAAVEQKAAEAAARKAEFEAAYGALIAKARPYMLKSEFVASLVSQAEQKAYLSEKQVAALEKSLAAFAEREKAAAASEWVGKIGERLTVEATVERVFETEMPSFGYGYGARPMAPFYVVTMRTAEGAVLVYKGSAYLAEKGAKVKVTGTVAQHTEYKGTKQTVIKRPKVVVLVAAPPAEPQE